jgi:hypothetical protein
MNSLPSFIIIMSITLPNLFIPDTLSPALLSTLIRSWLQIKPATLSYISFINVGNDFHCRGSIEGGGFFGVG